MLCDRLFLSQVGARICVHLSLSELLVIPIYVVAIQLEFVILASYTSSLSFSRQFLFRNQRFRDLKLSYILGAFLVCLCFLWLNIVELQLMLTIFLLKILWYLCLSGKWLSISFENFLAVRNYIHAIRCGERIIFCYEYFLLVYSYLVQYSVGFS